jgi:hypothetical protein
MPLEKVTRFLQGFRITQRLFSTRHDQLEPNSTNLRRRKS